MKTCLIIIIFFLAPFTPLSGDSAAPSLDLAAQALEKNMAWGSAAGWNNINYSSANPASAATLPSLNATLTYLNCNPDLNLFYANAASPLTGPLNLIARLSYLSMPPVTDIETGNELAYYEFSAGAGAGYRISPRISAGGLINFFRARMAGFTGTTAYADIGGNYQTRLRIPGSHRVVLGASILHLGPGVKFNEETSPLPLNFNLACQYIYNGDYRFLAGMRKYTAYDAFLYSVGSEIVLLSQVSLRAAVLNDVNNTIKYNLGMGFDFSFSDHHFLLDYAFFPSEEIAPVHAVTLTFRSALSAGEEEKKDEEKNWKNLWKSE